MKGKHMVSKPKVKPYLPGNRDTEQVGQYTVGAEGEGEKP